MAVPFQGTILALRFPRIINCILVIKSLQISLATSLGIASSASIIDSLEKSENSGFKYLLFIICFFTTLDGRTLACSNVRFVVPTTLDGFQVQIISNKLVSFHKYQLIVFAKKLTKFLLQLSMAVRYYFLPRIFNLT
jgi:hypothetical protein